LESREQRAESREQRAEGGVVQVPTQKAEKVLAELIQGDGNRGVRVVHAPDG
jgi:hypothetical protein